MFAAGRSPRWDDAKPMVGCAICGARVVVVGTGVVAPRGLKLRKANFFPLLVLVTFDDPSSPRVYITTRGRLVSPQKDTLAPEVWNRNAYRYVRTGAVVCPAENVESYDGKCYPIHGNCWEIFDLVAQKLLGIKKGEGIPERLLRVFVKMCEAAVYEGQRLIWPPGDWRVEEFWTLVNRGERGIEIKPSDLKRSPIGMILLLEMCVPAKNREGLSTESGGPGVSKVEATHQSPSFDVPAIFPLPVELTHKIISYLTGSEMLVFGTVDYPHRVQVPDFMWRDQFKARGEFGHVDNGDYDVKQCGKNWYTRFASVEKITLQRRNEKIARNCRRFGRIQGHWGARILYGVGEYAVYEWVEVFAWWGEGWACEYFG
ncbi:hypothetical protein ABW20_dc0102075 [Dactylellina cionopaga]|nr:hypothetical protein ABW20_dc0102075 [Dactylellina cionopaga]